MTDKLDLSRPVQDKDGKAVRYLGSIKSPYYPHVFAIPLIGSVEIAVEFDDYGRNRDDMFTLINVPEPKRSGAITIKLYENGECVVEILDGKIFRFMASSAYTGINPLLTCIGPIKWTEGEGLEK